ncbi:MULTISPECIES: hypothetical protein [unclassified Meiothermus]|uniref:InlB B-repeat-containing protein n=1 Tax=unclassified Meiothermus TaxID=370471 RepID=UPI0013144603|nr:MULTISPECIES: hypothetical protein [unclassified Meiothermus]
MVSQSFVGYFTDPNEPYPKTGDIAYVRAVSANVSGCVNDAVGFDFFLPDGATPVVSASYPVYCYRVRFSDGYTEAFTNDANGACSQTASTGPFGGLYYGWSAVAPGWWVEIRVPVRFNKQLLGLGGPNTHRLSAVAQTAYGNATPYQPVTVFYQASFQNTQSSGVTSTSATLATNLYSYYKSGLLYVDYGTSTSFGSSTPGTNVPNTSLNFPSVSTNLTGLNPSTTYYWRYRFVTDAGTFNSPTQTFTTLVAPTFALTLSKNGTGSGTVTSSPSGINCGATCSANFAQGTTVTLTATPASGSSFAGWSGACTGTGTCSVTMDAAKSVTATFNTAPTSTFNLTVNKAGSGSGTVTSNPSGINCGATCSAAFNAGTSVTLSTAAASGSTFAGWSGACTGTGTCTVTMNAAQTVTATFNTAPAGLTITAAKPANAPTDATRSKGQSNVAMLAFTLNPSQATQLQSITLQASGSGNDSLDLTAVKLIRDANANGQIDSGETPIANGTFSADNGTLTLTLSSPLALSTGNSQFLVAADIASTLAAHPAVLKAQSLPSLPAPLLLGLLPLMLLGAWRMRSLRAGFLALALALTLAACGGGDQNTVPVNKTYQINLTAVSAQGSPTVSGLPITGATITVQK